MAEHSRHELLETYGRYYGDQKLAVAFTEGLEGIGAKRVRSRGWDKTAPLADGDYGASYIAGRGQTRNPVIVLRASNLIGLECDSEEDLVRIESLSLPETVTVRSSEPYKRHYWFRPAPDLTSLPYVAFRFETGKLTADSGRYFVVPPALHPSGATYTFLPEHGPGEIAIATLAAGIYHRLAGQAHVEDDEQRQAIELDPSARFREGNRRNALFRYACMLRRWGLSYTDILEQTLRYNTLKCDPPVEPFLVEVQVEGAMKKKGGQELARDHPDPPEPPAEPPHDSWLPVDLNTLPAKPPVPPTLGGLGIVYPGKRHVFSGPQESAKTLAAYAIGIEIIRQGGTIILIDFEMGGYDARGRLHELGATPAEISNVRYLEPEEPANEERVQRLIALQPDLVIVDAAAGAYDIQGLDDNKRQDVERVARLYVRGFWRNGIATIMLDHVVKNIETRGNYAIGSERKVGGADVHLGFETILPISRGSSGLYKIVTHKDRGGFLQRGKLADFELHSDPQTHQIKWTLKPAEHADPNDPFRPTHLMEKVSQFLRGQPDPQSRNTVETSIKGNAKYIRDAINALIREEFISESAGARGAKLLRSIRPYKEDDPACNPEKPPTSSTSSDLVSTSSGRSQLTSSQLVPPLRGDAVETDEETSSTSSHYDDPETQYLVDKYVHTDEDAPPLKPEPSADPDPDDIPF